MSTTPSCAEEVIALLSRSDGGEIFQRVFDEKVRERAEIVGKDLDNIMNETRHMVDDDDEGKGRAGSVAGGETGDAGVSGSSSGDDSDVRLLVRPRMGAKSLPKSKASGDADTGEGGGKETGTGYEYQDGGEEAEAI